MSTSVYWCWNGNVVTSTSPVGGSTTFSKPLFWGWRGFAKDSYCCQGQSQWHLNRIGMWSTQVDNEWYTDCVRNEMHLYGNGTYTTNPGAWQLENPFGPPAC
jgi:hypothetical protein